MKDITPDKILLTLTVGISILTALVFLLKNRGFSILVRRFGAYVVAVALFELLSYSLVFVFQNSNNNLYLLHLYTLVEFVLIGLFFAKLFDLFEWKMPFGLIIFIGSILIILNSIFIQPLDEYNSFSRTPVQLVFMLGCFAAFYFFTHRNYPYADRGMVKMFLIALLLKYSGSLFLYLFGNQISLLQIETQKALWLVNASLNFIAQVIILIAILGWIIADKKDDKETLKQEYF
ncbi:MAG: hypothetical protein KDC85_10180 [Saprospiraceae bacterium]|nr:hypothetical protein [Saprospiraceae bacterium]MCB9323698.1 hypothetical protein [Lewinellaceae bacterium]